MIHAAERKQKQVSGALSGTACRMGALWWPFSSC